MSHDESKLPKWAQERLADVRQTAADLREELETIRLMNAVLQNPDRHWFTLPGPSEQTKDPEPLVLFFLERNQATPVCSLYKGDLLFVGRRPLPMGTWINKFNEKFREEPE